MISYSCNVAVTACSSQKPNKERRGNAIDFAELGMMSLNFLQWLYICLTWKCFEYGHLVFISFYIKILKPSFQGNRILKMWFGVVLNMITAIIFFSFLFRVIQFLERTHKYKTFFYILRPTVWTNVMLLQPSVHPGFASKYFFFFFFFFLQHDAIVTGDVDICWHIKRLKHVLTLFWSSLYPFIVSLISFTFSDISTEKKK